MKSWVGIGFGPVMRNTDMVVAQIFENDVVKIYEGIANGVIKNIKINLI